MRPPVIFLPVLFALTALTGAQSERRLLPVPDLPGYVTLKADFHLHSVFSDGEVWPTVHVREAWRDGLDAVSLTEHLEYRPHKADIAGGPMRAFEVARPLADRLGVVLVPGVEITRPAPGTKSEWPVGSAHFNVLFPTDVTALDTPDLTDALTRAKGQGAFTFWNHPGFMEKPAEWFPHIDALNRRRLFDGIEVVNGDRYYPEALAWAAGQNLTPMACSDAHLPMPAHLKSARRPVTLVFARSRDLAGIKEALEARRTLAWLDTGVWGTAPLLAALWKASVDAADASGVAGSEVELTITNVSAIDYALDWSPRVPWVAIPDTTLRRETTTRVTLRLAADAPAGRHALDVPVEVLTLRSAGEQPLKTTMSLLIDVSAPR